MDIKYPKINSLYKRVDMKERLERLSKLNNENACIEWTGASTGKGYGVIRIGSTINNTRRIITTHRLSYIVNIGDIPDGLWVLHKCDNKPCINPDHLFLGTPKDNMDDMRKKGRSYYLRAEKHPKSKLTWDKVREIRSLKNKIPIKKIAQKFNLSLSAIYTLLRNESWIVE